jgi:hypothetical protein
MAPFLSKISSGRPGRRHHSRRQRLVATEANLAALLVAVAERFITPAALPDQDAGQPCAWVRLAQV